MKRPSTVLAGVTLAAALLVSSCSADAARTATTASTSGAAVSTVSTAVTPVVELDYSDLGIDDADLSPDLADVVEVTLADGASEGGAGVVVDGNTVTVDAAGTYRVSGSLSSGSLVVDAPDAVVTLVLDGVDITAAAVAAVQVVDAEQVVLLLAAGSENSLADAPGATVDETVEDSPTATLHSRADLWIAGEGALSVVAQAADGITSTDTLVVAGGDITVEAADDGLRGKDQLVLTGGTVTADVGGDALRSDDDTFLTEPDAVGGVVWVDGATVDLTAGSDGVDAARQLTVLSGALTVAAGDDGLHSDNVLRIGGGEVAVTESVEGIEGAYVYLSGGDVSVVASDDGINVAGGAEALAETSEAGAVAGPGGAMAAQPGAGGGGAVGGGAVGGGGGGAAGPPPAGGGGRGGQAVAAAPVGDLASVTVTAMTGSGFGGPAEGDNGARFLELSGGTYVIDTMSDGVDVNGSMTMTGGTLVVSSTDDVRNGALDVDDTFTLSGGTLAANGTSTMAVAPGESSTQPMLALTFGSTLPAGTVISISEDGGGTVASFTTLKGSDSFIYSSDLLRDGAAYTVSVGGEATGATVGWLFLDGTVSGGDVVGTVPAS